LPQADIAADDSLTKVLDKLDTLYEKDKTQSAFEALEEFETYKRPSSLCIKEFCSL